MELTMPVLTPHGPNLSPICPIDLLPDPIKSAVLYGLREKDLPPAVALTDALAAAAAVVQCGFDCVTPDGDRLPSTLNTLAVAPSASGKGRSMKLFFAHFLAASKQRRQPPIEQDANGTSIPVARTPLVEAMMSTATFRALLTKLDGRGMSVTIQREEGSGFLKTDLFKEHADALAQAWSGDPPLDYSAHGVDLEAIDARCSVAFRIQPDLMTDYLRNAGKIAYKLGFWPRAIAGCHDPERFDSNDTYRPKWIPKTSPEAYQSRLTALAKEINARNAKGFAGRVGIELDSEAKAFMLELGQLLKDWKSTYYGSIREAAGRGWENTLRIAVVLHVFCVGRGKVSLALVECAWAIVEWSLSQHRLIFVDAVQPLPKQPSARATTTPKLSQHQRRLNEDCQFLIDTIAACAPYYWNGMVPVGEIQGLCGFEHSRFLRALAWVTNTRHVSVGNIGECATVRLPTPGTIEVTYRL